MKKITFLLLFMLTAVLAHAQYANMAIVGSGAGGWPGADGIVDKYQMTTNDNGVTWFYDNMVLTSGEVKFRTGNHWNPNTDNWGASSADAFPTGTAVVNSQTNIKTPAGIYDVTFNTATLAYTFTIQNLYPTVSLIGTGIDSNGDGKGDDVDTDLFTADGITYTGTDLNLIKGQVKFRQDHNETANWGNSAFPAGTGTQGGAGIEIPGTLVMNVTFNKNTGVYSFTVPSVALVGSATLQDWGTDPQIDVNVMASTDGISYLLNSIELKTGAAKFREGNNWAVQWGGDGGFPTGTGSQGGSDIPVTAGTYSVKLNRTTGAYSFEAPIAAANTFNAASFTVYPNPTANSWNFSAVNGQITNIQVTDVLGKTILSVAPKNTNAVIDASALNSGIYFARVSTSTSVKTVKIVKQ